MSLRYQSKADQHYQRSERLLAIGNQMQWQVAFYSANKQASLPNTRALLAK